MNIAPHSVGFSGATMTENKGSPDEGTELLGDRDRFVEFLWNRAPFVRRGLAPSFWQDLLTIADIDRIVGSRRAEVQLLDDGLMLDPAGHRHPAEPMSAYDRTWVSDPAALIRGFRAGRSLLMLGVDEWWPPIERLCDRFIRLLRAHVGATVYVAPPGAHSRWHYDHVHVFALQLHGTKRWQLATVPGNEGRTQPCVEVVATPGDLIYIPKRFLHDVWARDEFSVHVTLGVEVPVWADILRDAVDTALGTALGGSIPPDMNRCRSDAMFDEQADAALQTLRTVLETLDANAIRSARDRRVSLRYPSAQGAFTQSVQAHQYRAERFVRVAQPVRFERSADGCHLQLADRVISLADRNLADPIEKLLASDVPLLLPTLGLSIADSIVLGRRLVAEGVIELVEESAT